jgi:aqualysin 1
MNIRFTLTAMVAAATLAACSDPSGPAASAPADVANLPAAMAKASSAIEDAYIVTLSDDEPDPDKKSKELLAGIKGKGKIKHVYKHALKGFAIDMSSDDAAIISDMPGVLRVEQDVEMNVSTTETPVSWGLDRIDQRTLPLNQTYSFTSTGSGVRVYILDTGILPGHQEFGGRANTSGYTAIADGRGSVDCHGHGTHVAGTVAGNTTGIARSAQLYAVRVLDCNGSGSTYGVIAGIDWVISQRNLNPGVPMVANMSLGGGLSASLNDAVRRAVEAGVTFAVAAGNDNTNACNQSPASEPSALTVGATDNGDSRAYYSNYGSCLDIFAPGSGIVSAYYYSTSSYASMSGTSMASPHVAGIAAVILGDAPSSSPAQVRSTMLAAATLNVVGNSGLSSPNALLFNGFTAAPPPPTPAEPTLISSLTVTRTRSGNKTNMNLAWNRGTTGGYVEIWRSTSSTSRGSLFTSTPNDGGWTDSRVSTTYWYTVCQNGTCTNSAKAP